MNEIEIRREKMVKWTRRGVMAGGVILVAPVAFTLAYGLAGLAAAGAIAFVSGQAFIHFAPVVADRFATWKLKGLKQNARDNPVEKLELGYIADCKRVEVQAQAITDFDTEVRNFRTDVKGLKQQFPDDSDDFDATLGQLEELLAARRDALTEANAVLVRKKGELTKARAKWKVAMSAQRAGKAGGMTEEQVLEEVLRDTALGSIDTELNRALAALDTAVAREVPKLHGARKVTLDVVPAREKEVAVR